MLLCPVHVQDEHLHQLAVGDAASRRRKRLGCPFLGAYEAMARLWVVVVLLCPLERLAARVGSGLDTLVLFLMLGAVIAKHNMAWRAIDYKVRDQNGFNSIIVKRIREFHSKSVVTKNSKREKNTWSAVEVHGWVAAGITKPVENRSGFSLTDQTDNKKLENMINRLHWQ